MHVTIVSRRHPAEINIGTIEEKQIPNFIDNVRSLSCDRVKEWGLFSTS